MKNPTLRTTATLLVATALLVGLPAVAKAPRSVTGSMHFALNGVQHHLEISAREGIPTTGTLQYSGSNGMWYTVAVDYVRIEGNSAWVAGHVTDTNFPHLGTQPWLRVVFTDGGESGQPDSQWGVFTGSQAIAFNWVVAMGMIYPGNSPAYSESGNLTVH